MPVRPSLLAGSLFHQRTKLQYSAFCLSQKFVILSETAFYLWLKRESVKAASDQQQTW